MGQVLQFARPSADAPADDVDEVIAFHLMTAIDSAIRELKEIGLVAGSPAVRKKTDECRRKLQKAFDAAVRESMTSSYKKNLVTVSHKRPVNCVCHSLRMGLVIPFPEPEPSEPEIDLVEATGWALRDLNEFMHLSSDPWLREQAKCCHEMLQKALTVTLREG